MSTTSSAREYQLASRFLALPKERRAELFTKLQAQGIDLAVLPVPVTPPGPERERLSYAQERLWFLGQLEPDSAAYNMAGALRLRGELDRAALARALGAIGQRHEALRTTFETHAGKPRARVHESAALELCVSDARAEFAQAGEACVSRWAEREAEVVFDLERGPLVRVSLVQLAAADHALFVCMHHIVSDGWSLRVFIDELTELYAAALASQALELPALQLQYADYATWQRSWLEAGELDKQLGYWRTQLAGQQGVLPLPWDRPRPAEQSHRGALLELALPVALAQELRQLARSHGVTMFMLGLAAFATLLQRVTGRTDVCVGSSIANRKRLEIESLIGFFVNTQVLRVRPDGRQSFAQLLAAVKQIALEAQSHQDLPFEQLVDALSPERSLGHNPLFQVHYDHQQRAYSSLRTLPGLSLEPIAREQRSTLFDLTLTSIEQPDGSISLHLEYATDLFDRQTIELLAGRLVRVLEQVVVAPGTSLARLSLGGADQRAQLDAQPWAADAITQGWLGARAASMPELASLRGEVLDAALSPLPVGLAGDLYLVGPSAAGERVHTGEWARLRRDGSLELIPAAAPSGQRSHARSRTYTAPETDLERSLCEVWQDVLQVPQVSATDNFFELGGDSIVSIQVVSRARERGIALRPKDLFQHQTVRKLASVAKQATARRELAAMSGEVALTPIQAAFFARELPEPHHYNQSVLLECKRALDPRALERALEAVIAQHAVLRTSFRRAETGWQQHVEAPDEERARRVLSTAHLSDHDEIEPLCAATQRSLDLGRGELMRALHLRLSDGGSLLLLVIHHLVVDGVSWRILLEDLQRGYQAACEGRALDLPGDTSAFAVWTQHLVAHASSPALAEEAEYWHGVVAALPELPRDREPEGEPATLADVARGAVRLDRAATERLLKHSAAAYRTQPQELLLSALARALCDTFEQRSVAVLLEGHGREDLFEDVDVSRTLGWFTTEYPVVLAPEREMAGTIQAVKEQLRAVPAHGIGYGVLQWLGPEVLRAPLAAAARPRVTFNYLGQFDAAFGEDSLFRVASQGAGAEAAASTPLASWLEINGQVYAGELTLWIGFSPMMYRPATIERLAARFEQALHELIAHCTTPGAGALTPSDFPLARLDRAQLAALAPHAAIEDLYPVTPMQHGILFHALYDQEPGVYVTQLAVTIDGLDPARFAAAWARALARHPILRTSFAWQGLAEPIQRVSSQAELALEQLDLRGHDDQARELERIVSEQHRRAFDLERAPPWRIALVQLDARRHHFIWTHHHLLLDGWSTARLLDEVLLDYLDRARPDVSPAFVDYVAWLARRDRGANEAFWRERLRALSEPTLLAGHLMGALVAAGEPNATGVQLVRTRLTVEQTRALTEIAQRAHVTLNTLVQAAWSILLARYTGQAQVVFGATTSGRPAELPGAERMLGLFINTLPVVVSAQPEASLSALWQAVQAYSLDAREHEHAPLAEIQRWAGHGRGDLFDTLIVFENFPVDQALAADWESLSFSELHSVEITNYALTLAVRPGATLELDYGFDPARIPARAVERIAEQLLGLLHDFATTPAHARAAELALHGAKAEQVGVAPPQAAGPFEPAHDTILRRLRTRRAADDAVVIGGAERWTAAELAQRAVAIALQLRALGVQPESRVGLYVERGPWLIAGALGIMQAGGAYVPLDPKYPAERLSWMVADAGLCFVLGESSRPALAGVSTLEIEALAHAAAPLSAAVPLAPVHPDQLAYLIYTSGSTGTPKGVGVAHAALAMHAHAVAAIYDNDERDCALHMASASFDAAVEQWVVPLISGARLVLCDEQPWTPRETLEVLRRDRVTVMYPPTGQIIALAEWLEQTGEIYTLRACCVGGEAVSRESAALIRRTLRPQLLINGYGPTETVVTPTLWRATPEMVCESAYAPIGWVVGDRSGYVLDAELNVQPRGVAGELYLGGSGMARGYLGRAGLTAERFVPDPFSAQPGARLYRTGDRVRALPDGTIEYLGRIDQQVKLRGHRIELGEIEARLLAQPDVNEAVVVVRHDLATPRLVAYVGCADEAARAELPELLLAQLRAALPAYMVPAQLVVLARLPQTPNGKIDRPALPAPELARREPRPARTELERELLGYFEHVLRDAALGVEDDFFERGGDSLSSLQLVSRVRAAGHVLTLKDVFTHRSVEALARALTSQRADAPPLPAPAIERVSREGTHALSYAQERLWFLAQLEPDSAAYNISGGLRLRGRLELSFIQRAFEQLVAQHAALRTGFEAEDGRGVQRVHAAVAVPVRLLDARGAAAETRARALFSEDSARPFALAQAPLLRVSLIQLGDEDHVLVVTLHHLIADGWSMRLLIDELAQLYTAYARGDDPGLDAPAVEYLDYAVWQRSWLEAGEGARQLEYWRAQLGDEHPVLALPTDHARPVVQSYRGGLHDFALDGAASAAVLALARVHGVSVFMLLLAAFQGVLYRLTGQRDLRIGVPVSNRNRLETERVVGLFVNTQVLRTELSGELSFEALLARVRETALGAQAHQDLPFERLVDALQPERSLSHNPLFQVMFDHQRAGIDALRSLPGLTVEAFEGDARATQFDLSLTTVEDGGRISGNFTYASDLFEPATIAALSARFQRVLRAVVEDPAVRLSELAVLGEAERSSLMAAALPVVQRSWSEHVFVHARISEQAQMRPDARALEGERAGDVLTYAQLERLSNQWAQRLRALGVGAEAKIGLCVGRSPRMVVGALAILKAGGAYVSLDPSYPLERLRTVVADAKLSLIMGERAQPVAAELGVDRCVWLDADDVSAEPDSAPAVRLSGENLAYVVYTSGSTGRPKGVGVSHAALAQHIAAIGADYGMTPADCSLHFASLSFDAGLEQWASPLTHGARLFIRGDAPWSAERAVEVLRERGVSWLDLPPGYLREVAQVLLDRGETLQLRACLVGGEAVSREALSSILRAIHPAPLVNAYGPTESVITPMTWHVTDAGACTTAHAPIGRVIGARRGYVLDDDLNLVAVGVTGELYLGGASQARGYVDQAGMTAERFVADPYADEPGSRMYRTGDLARVRADGSVEYLGRADHQVKIRGFRVELGEVESQLLAQPGVREAAVVAQGGALASRLIGYVAGEVDAELLRTQLRAALPEYMLPSQLLVLDELPRNSNGKLDRKRLPAPEAVLAEYIAPRTEIEAQLCAIFGEVLALDQVGVSDNFFALGGDSIRSLQVISRARKLGIELSPRDLFERQTPAELAHLPASSGTNAVALEPIPRDAETYALSFAQERLWFLAQLEPLSAAYNIAGAVRVRGLEPDVMQAAVDALVARHETLRTTFEAADGDPRQRIHDALQFRVRIESQDLSLDASQAESRARSIVEERAHEPFDLERGPLLRVAALKLSDTEHVLALVMHHAISDGWSIDLAIVELADLYAAARGASLDALELAALLPPLPVQYIDYAAWQRRWLAGPELAQQLAYWQAELGSEHPVLALPLDRPRPAEQTYRGALLTREFDAALAAELHALARARGVTLFMLLLAVWQTLLYRLTGQRDIRVGVPITNRNRLETEGLIGLFVNTQVLRGRLSGELRFDEVLEQVKRSALGASAHRDLPFEQLVEALQPERSLAYNPLFQVTYNHASASVAAHARKPSSLELSELIWQARGTQFDLSLDTEELTDGRLAIAFTYAIDLFDASTIHRLAARFETLLRQIAREPLRRIAELTLLDERERAQLMAASEPRDPEAHGEPGFVHAWIDAQAQLRPAAIALEGETGGTYTYAELERVSNQWAQRLRALGVRAEANVGLCLGRSPEMVMAALAILKAGGSYVPLDPSYPLERLRAVVADAGVQLVVSEGRQAFASELGAAQVVRLDAQDVSAEPATCPEVALSGASQAYVVYTSGSTGRPKGVSVSHEALARHVAAIGRDYGMVPQDCALHFASMSFDAGVEQWVSPLVHGARLFVRGDELWSAERAVEVLRERAVSWFEMPPGYLREVAEAALERGERLQLRACSAGGEAVSRESLSVMLRAVSPAPVINGYGPTETVITPMTWHASELSQCTTAYAPIGRVIGPRRGYVLDDDLNLVPAGVIGELYLGGSSIARGYAKRPALTAERFFPDPHEREPGSRMYRTGDLARWHADGSVEYVGRADHQVKVRGFRIELGEIEAQLLAQPGVREAVVTADGGALASRLIGYVAGDVDAEALRLQLRAALPEYMVPARLLVLPELPRNSNGKVDRKLLPEVDAVAQAYVAARTPIEERLCEIWRDVLAVERVGLSDNFFDLGGHSLLVMRVVTRVRRELGVELAVRQLFETSDVAELAAVIERASAAQTSVDDAVAGALSELEDMSEEELARLLSEAEE